MAKSANELTAKEILGQNGIKPNLTLQLPAVAVAVAGKLVSFRNAKA